MKFILTPKDLMNKKDICNKAHEHNSLDSMFCSLKGVTGETLDI